MNSKKKIERKKKLKKVTDTQLDTRKERPKPEEISNSDNEDEGVEGGLGDAHAEGLGHEEADEDRGPLKDERAHEREAELFRVFQDEAPDVSRAAQDLGITRTSLYRRMEKYGL